MSAASLHLAEPAAPGSPGAMVRVGLAEFARRQLERPDAIFEALLGEAGVTPPWPVLRQASEAHWPHRSQTPGSAPLPPRLARLVDDHGLALPEVFLLALAGEVETSHAIDIAVGTLQAPAALPWPSVHLCVALVAALFDRPDFTAQHLHDSALVRAGLLELAGEGPLPLRCVRIQPALWAVLQGQASGWPGAQSIPTPGAAPADGAGVPARLVGQLDALADALRGGAARGTVLRGSPGSGRLAAAATLAQRAGLRPVVVPPVLWQEQPALRAAARYADWLAVLRLDLGPGEVWRLAGAGEPSCPAAILVGGDGAVQGDALLELDVPLPAPTERRAVWARALGEDAPADATLVDRIAREHLVSAPAIRAVAGHARLLAAGACEPLAARHLAEARRRLGADRLRLLAQPIERHVDRDELVVPERVREDLDVFVARCRARETLWERLGPTLRATRSAGARALFVGESGTGKTLAASLVATELGSPLYRVDIASVMNKYIGESEKNLAALLDHAAAHDVVLLFDEADSLFGRRSEARETGERYANMLTNYLLTRIETHPGVVVLTSNSRERIDSAFTRRLDAIVEFPPPGLAERLALWRVHLGGAGPDDDACAYLASYCDLAGGHIRNAVLTAATRAGGTRIAVADLIHGLDCEYRKLGRSLPVQLDQLR